MNQVLIHFNESAYIHLNLLGLKYTQSNGELNVIVNDIDSTNDEELCTHYGIDYDYVNCIEAA